MKISGKVIAEMMLKNKKPAEVPVSEEVQPDVMAALIEAIHAKESDKAYACLDSVMKKLSQSVKEEVKEST